MTKLCIKKFEKGNEKPLTTVSIPLAVLKMVKSLIPKKTKEELQKEGIDIQEIIKLSEYDRIICMDESEHKPMVLANPSLQNDLFDYWDIIDRPKVKSEISLPKCYQKVKDLLIDSEFSG